MNPIIPEGTTRSTSREGKHQPPNSDRDNYFSRAQMWGSVLSGGLVGHVRGTAAYDITSTGEPAGARHHIWDSLKYKSGNQMQHLHAFIFSEGARYQQLQPHQQHLHPQKAKKSSVRGWDGWSLMMLTQEKDLGMLYYENRAELPKISGLKITATIHFMI